MKIGTIYQGNEMVMNEIGMGWKAITNAIFMFAMLHAAFVAIFIWDFLPSGGGAMFIAYLKSLTILFVPGADSLLGQTVKLTLDGNEFTFPAATMAKNLAPRITVMKGALYKTIFVGGAIVWPLMFVWFGYLKNKASQLATPRYVAGTKFYEPSEINQNIKNNGQKTRLPFGGWYTPPVIVKGFVSVLAHTWPLSYIGHRLQSGTSLFYEVNLPIDCEPTNVGIFGGIGSGKSVFLAQVLHGVKANNFRAMVHDPKGELFAKHGKRGQDLIFNLIDSDCLRWTISNEFSRENPLKRKTEQEGFWTSLIPSSKGGDTEKFFNDAARAVAISGSRFLDKTYGPNWTNRQLWDFFSQPISGIAKAFDGVDECRRGLSFIQDAVSGNGGKQSIGVHAVLMQHIQGLELLAELDGPFSIREWVENGKGIIYLINNETVRDIMKPMLSLFIDYAGKSVLSLKPDRNRRIFFLLDEFGTLQRLPTIVDLMTKGRGFGSSIWIALQDIGQVDNLYGRDLRKSIINSCNNIFVLRVSESETAESLMKTIGKTRMKKTRINKSFGIAENRDGEGMSEEEKDEYTIMDSDIMAFKPLHGIAKIDGHGWYKTAVAKWFFPDEEEAFVIRNDVDLAAVTEKAAAIQAAVLAAAKNEVIEVKPTDPKLQQAQSKEQEQDQEQETADEAAEKRRREEITREEANTPSMEQDGAEIDNDFDPFN